MDQFKSLFRRLAKRFIPVAQHLLQIGDRLGSASESQHRESQVVPSLEDTRIDRQRLLELPGGSGILLPLEEQRSQVQPRVRKEGIGLGGITEHLFGFLLSLHADIGQTQIIVRIR